MVEDVTVVNEIPYVWTAEVHSQCDARIWTYAGPIWNVDRVSELLLLGRQDSSVLRESQEMKLVHVELVILHRAIFDCPVFY